MMKCANVNEYMWWMFCVHPSCACASSSTPFNTHAWKSCGVPSEYTVWEYSSHGYLPISGGKGLKINSAA